MNIVGLRQKGEMTSFLEKENEAPSIQLRIDKWIKVSYIIVDIINDNIRNHY
jgi:hypothetical protein